MLARSAPAAPEAAPPLPAALANAGFSEIVFVKRKPFSSDHYYTDIDNGTSPDRFVPENGIYLLDLRSGREHPVVTAAQMPGGSGLIGKISLSFDARTVIFDFRQDAQSGFRIWEVNLDGTGLRQLTFPPADEGEKVARLGRPWHTDDIHPCYLPDGGIIFSSTRCERTILCGGSAALVAPLLHRMDADGGNLVQLTQSPVSEFCPVVLDDGRVMYHRWEYVDKGARVCKTIWSMNPDGSKAQELYGVSDDTTTVYMYPQPLPGSTEQLVCVGTCHYPQGGCVGAIMRIDLNAEIQRRGPDPDEPGFGTEDQAYAVRNLTPEVFVERRTEPGWHFRTPAGGFTHDRSGQSGRLFTQPFPVSTTEFLVSCKIDPADHFQNDPDAYALCLLEADGGLRAVHRDAALSCWHPLPVKPRGVPPVLRPARNPELAAHGEAVCFVQDVYEGMPGVERGSVRWIRVNEVVPRYWDTGRRWPKGNSSSGWKAALWPRVQWGVVPVEADGSAHFTVPASRNLFFQALDENFREVQRERTYVNYQPGEVRSCTGCHGRNHQVSPTRPEGTRLALQRPPRTLQPQPCDLVENGGDGSPRQVIHYPTDIQPIFDAKCVSCHGGAEPGGGLRLTGELTPFYNTSYEELCRKELAGPLISEFTSFAKGDQGNYNGITVAPRTLGSPASALMAVLSDPTHRANAAEDHTGLLSEMERMVLARWVDSNYQFYGTYYGRQNAVWAEPDPGQPAYQVADFRRRPTFAEAISASAPDWHR